MTKEQQNAAKIEAITNLLKAKFDNFREIKKQLSESQKAEFKAYLSVQNILQDSLFNQ